MNLLDSQECSAEQESCTIVWEDETLRIEKIVSFGQVTPPEQEYCQNLPAPDTAVLLMAGDHMMIPPGKRHRVIYTSKPCIWLCVFEKCRGTADE